MTAIDLQIQEAEQAAQEVERLRRLKEQADSLPALIEQAELERKQDEYHDAMGAVFAESSRTFYQARADMAEWSERFNALVAELDALGAEYKELQRQIYQAGRNLKQAAHNLSSVSRGPIPDPGDVAAMNRYHAPTNWADLLARAGGTNPGLAASLDKDTHTVRVFKLMRDRARAGEYNPGRGVGNFEMRL